MPVTRRVARPMLAAMFVSGGVDQLRRPESKVAQAEKVAATVAQTLHLPEDPVMLVRLNGAVQVGAASLLAMGKLPRLSAAALAASLVPTTLAGHRFWEEHEPGRRTAQRTSFLKNVSMLGGLVLAATDTEGRPSLSWRARRAATKTSRRIGATTHKVGKAIQEVEKAAETAAHKVERAAGTAAHKVQDAAETGAHKVAAAVPVGHH
ncbi:MAG TPA: DoxX family protein [Acidimicrobiales bacterium]|nr:DoxX family protein [Acidimicrobiales bacterium]